MADSNKKAYWCAACAMLRAIGCAGSTPAYYCDKLKQPIARPANCGCSYFKEEAEK